MGDSAASPRGLKEQTTVSLLSSCGRALAVDEGWEVEADKVARGRLTHRGDISSVMHDHTSEPAGFERRRSKVVGTVVRWCARLRRLVCLEIHLSVKSVLCNEFFFFSCPNTKLFDIPSGKAGRGKTWHGGFEDFWHEGNVLCGALISMRCY